ncbi:MAG TPA: nuclear transport factor 2 family protein [Caulobacteraceae bacterium]
MSVLRLVCVLALLAPMGAFAAPRPGSIEARLQRVEDQLQIQRVLIEYGKFLDAKDYASYAALFAKDGEWIGGFGHFKGPAAIQKMLEDKLGKAAPGYINKSSYHLMSSPLITVNGDTATAESRYLFFTASPDNKPIPTLAGRYVDQFVREGGAWKIQRRVTWGVIPWRDGDDPNPAPPPGR